MRPNNSFTAKVTAYDEHEDEGSPTAVTVNPGQPRKRVSGAYSDIWIACAVISLPLIVLSGVLLGLVFQNRVNPGSSTSAEFRFPQVSDNDQSAYFVDISATRLITIASWSSSCRPIASGVCHDLAIFSDCAAHIAILTTRPSRITPNALSIKLVLGVAVRQLWIIVAID